jgi:hypothetical protein
VTWVVFGSSSLGVLGNYYDVFGDAVGGLRG